MKRILGILVFGAAFAVSVSTPAAIVIQNADFEGPDVPGTGANGWQNYTAAGQGLTGWTVIGDVDLVDSSHIKAQSNQQSIDLNGSGQGGITQLLSVSPADYGQYMLSFWYTGNFRGGNLVKPVFETLGGQFTLKVPSAPADPLNPNWVQFTAPVTINQNLLLSFVSLTDGAYGPMIDNISLTAVPEPYHYGLASVLGLMGLVVADRMRNRKLVA